MQGPTNRIDAIDFVKGMLVLLMVAYHALNYLGYEALPHAYLAFVPLSFILIAGFLIMNVHWGRTRSSADGVAPRLASRALKLLIIFIALNVAARAIWARNHYGAELSIQAFFANWFDVFVTVQAKAVAFNVLVPISYTILLSIVVLALRTVSPWLPTLLAGLAIAACVWLELVGRLVYNMQFISAGLIGLALGCLDLRRVDAGVESRVILSTVLVAYVVVILLKLDNYLSQIFITIVSVIVLYALGRAVDADRWSVRQIRLLGRYSLLSYIVQILLLQGTSGIERLGIGGGAFGRAMFLMSVVVVLMWTIVLLVELGRSKAKGFDRVYRLVFA